ncbi:PrsW family intramembrane metalloprotease [Corynebacterium cystitidis]|uniref:PrsW family intramembrane metalloprotease n=1 Tax=Corynebacterium cystitidis TaxID=35757 RepID=UPI00211E7837|nr:PrsW family intramembrane metalloprotease [Corynebacterium cystitidis]
MSTLFRNTLIILVAISIPVVLLLTVSTLLVDPLSGLLTNLLGVLLVTVVLLILRSTPIWVRSPAVRGRASTSAWWVLCSLLWGAGVSLLMVIPSAGAAVGFALSLRWPEAMASFGGAWPEEPAKALGVLFILMSFRQFTRPWHGFLVGMVVGLGFDAAENALYGSAGGTLHASSDVLGMLETWAVRLVAGPLLHVGFTGIVGWGIGLALYVVGKSLAWRIQVVAVYFLASLTLHFAWNYAHESETAYVVKFALVGLIFYGLWIYVWVRAVRAARADDTYVHTFGALTSVKLLPQGSHFPQGPHRR